MKPGSNEVLIVLTSVVFSSPEPKAPSLCFPGRFEKQDDRGVLNYSLIMRSCDVMSDI